MDSKKSDNNQNIISLERIANSIYPNWTLEDWVKWPPNIFALISTVLYRTGSYKICLTETEPVSWDDSDWQDIVENSAECWQEYATKSILNNGIAMDDKWKTLIFPCYRFNKEDLNSYTQLAKNWSVTHVDDLRTVGQYENKTKNLELRQFAATLIVILAISDTCCRGLGSVGQDAKDEKKKLRLYDAIGNLMLNNTGSLSTIPKFFGVVLPKMRTPQLGIGLRNLTHYATFHTTEVEVMWRTFPWLNNHKKSLNILAIPYPPSIDKNDFESLEDRNHPVRYFKVKYLRNENMDFFDQLITYICTKADTNNPIDLLVFPEMSLNNSQYTYLRKGLYEKYHSLKKNIQLPIIVAGVIEESKFESSKGEEASISDLKSNDNELKMNIFFAGKWYNITQLKHHRWQLDRSQIIQYELENVLTADKDWYEYIAIAQRRLTILAPNGWLALTSLICEDLARQEPIGEVIRGVGPTLLLALLSDGPQLTTRWSSRYASILAEDPGTAVLSLTSKGMAEKSKHYSDSPNHAAPKESENGVVVGLWKDKIRGSKELTITLNNDAIEFTISAEYQEEFTLDGRTDHTNASVFRMDTLRPAQVNFTEYNKKCEEEQNAKKPFEQHSNASRKITVEDIETIYGSWYDLRELSAFLFSIDVVVDLLSIFSKVDDDGKAICNQGDINTSIAIITTLLASNNQKTNEAETHFFSKIQSQIRQSWTDPNQTGIAEKTNKKETNDMNICMKETLPLIDKIKNTDHSDLHHYYKNIIEMCESGLNSLTKKKSDEIRIRQITYVCFLFTINTKLSNWKSRKDLQSKATIKWSQILLLKKEINRILDYNLQNIYVYEQIIKSKSQIKSGRRH